MVQVARWRPSVRPQQPRRLGVGGTQGDGPGYSECRAERPLCFTRFDVMRFGVLAFPLRFDVMRACKPIWKPISNRYGNRYPHTHMCTGDHQPPISIAVAMSAGVTSKAQNLHTGPQCGRRTLTSSSIIGVVRGSVVIVRTLDAQLARAMLDRVDKTSDRDS